MQEEEEGKSEMDPQDRIVQERQEAVGEEMMVVLSTLGEVRLIHVFACLIYRAPTCQNLSCGHRTLLTSVSSC